MTNEAIFYLRAVLSHPSCVSANAQSIVTAAGLLAKLDQNPPAVADLRAPTAEENAARRAWEREDVAVSFSAQEHKVCSEALTRCVEERKLESLGLRITPGFAELLVTFKLAYT